MSPQGKIFVTKAFSVFAVAPSNSPSVPTASALRFLARLYSFPFHFEGSKIRRLAQVI